MRTRTLRFSLVLAVIVVSVAAFFIGYGTGHRATVRADTQFGLLSYSTLYRFAQQGDTNRLNDWLRFLIFSHYDYYQRNFTNETEEPEFSKRLQEARVIADQERTNVVTFDTAAFIKQMNSEMRTNRNLDSVSTNK